MQTASVFPTSTNNLPAQLAADVADAAEALGDAPCKSPLDFAMKAIALRALISSGVAYAATANDPAAIMLDADTLADLTGAMAADAAEALAGRVTP